ncbi:serine hydrolase domain-containing protein [Phenylobacterium sp.]|uniref:serine hydrolase domain-containing protein n=1 Tax=Phenylobacterium sp. TaxID=1871053 RepID=UPI002DED3F0D|nr:serine hydrolase domain-containing protein [Phenylobacterium sp.]
MKKRSMVAALIAAVAFAAGAGAQAPAPKSAEKPAAVQGPKTATGHELTAVDAEAWLDGLVPNALKTGQVPGAVIVVVKNGQVLVEKGYGFADNESRAPVDPRATLFRPGSTSKLFTWTAVMQLVEAGKLNLDADVNTYLDFKIPAYKGYPVTLRQIMTHRAGFEERANDTIGFGKPPAPLGDFLKKYVPPRMFTPDEGPGYSNYATAVAGYIVQRVSGEPYDDYIERHILTPLDMRNSTFRQPLPAAMRPHMATGYVTSEKVGSGYEFVGPGPAGALASTGDDMAHFMIAHLQLGRYGDTQILKPETAKLMQTTVTRAMPDLNGNLLGFMERNINGHRAMGHAGDTNYFHSDLVLFPDDQVGFFISVNAPGKGGAGAILRDTLMQEFADRYLPAAATVTTRVDTATAKKHAAMMAGAYNNTRGAKSTFLSLLGLLSQNTVTANPDGTITARPLYYPAKFVEVKPFLWQEVGGHDRIEALVKDGKVVRWASDGVAPIEIYVRPTGFAATGLEKPLSMASLALLALTALLWPVVAFVRWRYGRSFELTGARAHAYRAVRVGAVLSIAGICLWLFDFTQALSTKGANLNLLIHLAQLTCLLGFAGGLVAAIWNLTLVFKPGSSWFAKLFAVLLALAFGFMLWMCLHYHLIGTGVIF